MYTLNADEARKAEKSQSKFINKTGAYVGKIVEAQNIIAATGTKGLRFKFVSDDGQQTRFDLYTLKEMRDRNQILTAEKLPGYFSLMSLMSVMRIRQLEPRAGRVLRWDSVAKQELEVTAEIFPELCKPVGLLLRMREYEKKNGEIGNAMEFAGAFDPISKQVASEILDQSSEATKLEIMIENLRDAPLRDKKIVSKIDEKNNEGMDDDIPF